MALPHIVNSKAGVNRWDPMHNCMFEVYFTVPAPLATEFGADEALLTEQVQKISGLDNIDAAPEVVTQKFMGTTRSYLKPKLGDTSLEFEIDLALNLRNGNDNFVYKLFKAWNKLGYDITTGATTLKNDYVADWIKVSIANRANDIIREIVLKDVMLTGVSGATGEFNYDGGDPMQLTVKFKTDWWKETIA